MKKYFCLILITQYFVGLSQPCYGMTEADFCTTCSESRRLLPKIVTSVDSSKLEGWTTVSVPASRQASQIDAGLPMGCVLTSILYTLKFGPAIYRKSYDSIPGHTDVERIRALAARFSKMKSREKPGEPAFSEKHGMNPNDLSWMFQSLVSEAEPLTLTTFLAPMEDKKNQGNEMLKSLHKSALKSLSSGRPIIANLLFTNPTFAHAVVLTGIENQISSDNDFKIRIFDPGTGKESTASVGFGSVKLGESVLQSLKFSNPEVNSQAGSLLSVSQ